MEDEVETGEVDEEHTEERDLSHIVTALGLEERLSPEEQEKKMLAEGWVPATGEVRRGPPQRPVPMPPRKTTIPGMFDKFDYDASHMYQDLLVQQVNVEEDEPKIEVDLTNKQIGKKYEVVGELGRGATAIVKSAKDKQTGLSVAIKCITNETISFASFYDLSKKTSHYLTVCSCPSVIKLIECEQEEGAMFLVLELCHGTLVHLLKSTQLEWTQKATVSVLRQILEGVQFIHSKNLIHGDLTPGNLLSLDCYGKTVKISGFTKISEIDTDQDLFTEAHFKAPEVVQKTVHGKPVDIWAVGCISYLLLSGTLPFEDSNIMRLNSVIKEAKVIFPENNWKGIDENAQDFIRKLLTKDLNGRLTAEQALQHPWILGGGSEGVINIHQRLNTVKSLQ